jgi:hypothetical protein
MLYRVKQFFKALSVKVTMDDKKFVGNYLNEGERELFYSLPEYEQAHCLRVAKDVLRNCRTSGEKQRVIVRAALLHDIGKLAGGLNIVTKSIMVLLDRGMPGLIRHFQRLKMVDTYYNHPEKAFLFIRDEKDYFCFLIRNHHNYSMSTDEGLKLLQDADSRN